MKNKIKTYPYEKVLIILKVLFFLLMATVGAAIFLLITYIYN